MNRVNEKICRSEVPQVGQFEFFHVEIFMAYPYLEQHIMFYSNGLAIWSGFPDITHIKWRYDLVSVRILPNFELILAISEMDIWYKFWSGT